MPPVAKISKEMVLEAAFALARRDGYEQVNARSIAKTLGCSTQPVFSYYTDMATLKADLFARVDAYHSEYFQRVALDEHFFLNVGLAYIDFALEEPHLFRLLFMSDGFSGKKLTDFIDEECNDYVVSGIPASVAVNPDSSKRVFTDMWLYAHGIASLLVSNQLHITREEISSMVNHMFRMLTHARKE